MNYNEAVEYIHSLLKFGIKPGLERINALLNELGNPQNDMKFIHVAGTNGKGTTSTMLSNILIASGKKTGLFTSPYVFDFCERIRINNENIPKNDLAEIVTEVKSAIDKLSKIGIEPTEFETITAAALLYFKRENCDYAVMEVGLGGRFDSTNIIPCPKACVITSISLDHTSILGDTVEQIAYEKCGIIKENTNVITTSLQNENAIKIIKNTANEKNAKLSIADFREVEIVKADIHGTDIIYKNKKYSIPLVGEHQVENTIGVIEAANTIENISYDNIFNGIKSTVIHARMELIAENVFIDGGHNEECSLALKSVIEKHLKNKKITAVIGMMADKDCEKYLQNILPYCERVIFTKPDNPRSEEPENLKNIAQNFIKKIDIENVPKIAYDISVKESEFVLVCGSFYMLSDIFNN